MHKIVIIILLFCHAVTAGAQTFTDRLQRKVSGQGTVTVTQDAAISALVNGPKTAATAAPKAKTPAEAARKASADDRKDSRPATVTQRTEPADTTDDAPDTHKKVMANSHKVTGYRVQAYAGGNTRRDRQAAEQAGNKIKASFPDEPIYVHFYAPRWICRVGNYRTYEEAHRMLMAIQKLGYKQASIVKGKISVQY